MRPLNPGDPRAHIAPLGFLRKLERDPGIFWQVVLRRVTASVEVQRQCGRALLERLAEKINSAND
jgi:hypothetical protein